MTVNGQHVGTLAAGDYIGEVALLDGGPLTATVVAVTDVVAEVSSRREFEQLLAHVPKLAKRLLVDLARRLRHADPLLTCDHRVSLGQALRSGSR